MAPTSPVLDSGGRLHEGPRANVGLFFDYTGTLGWGGGVAALLRHINASPAQIARWESIREETASMPRDIARAARHEALVVAMTSGALPAITLRDLRARGRNESLFPGASAWLTHNRQHLIQMSHGQALPHYAMFTGEFAEVIRASSIGDKFDQLVAQECHEETRAGARLIVPNIAHHTRTKSQKLSRVVKDLGLSWSCVVFFGDSRDALLMKYVTSRGGTTVGVYAPDERGELERQHLLDLGESVVNYVVRGDYRPGSDLHLLMRDTVNPALCARVAVLTPEARRTSPNPATGFVRDLNLAG